jgi:hypothetical protein
MYSCRSKIFPTDFSHELSETHHALFRCNVQKSYHKLPINNLVRSVDESTMGVEDIAEKSQGRQIPIVCPGHTRPLAELQFIHVSGENRTLLISACHGKMLEAFRCKAS